MNEETKTRVISEGPNRREVVVIERDDKGKRTSTTHHELFIDGKWKRRMYL